VKFWLASRQIRHVAQAPPCRAGTLCGTITLAAHQKAADYTIAKARFGLLELAWARPCCWAGRCWAASPC
jgi:STE24 endopeptidase